MTQDNEMQVYDHRPLDVAAMKSQVSLIQDVMKSVMKDGEHFGKIPGCGDKPTLLQPGAQKLIMTFRLVPDAEVEVVDLFNSVVQGHREYRVKVKMYAQNGVFLGSGVGSCSTMESKYRYRTGPKTATGKPVPKEYWDTRKTDPIKAQELIGGKGYSTMKDDSGQWVICEQGEKVEHDNPADYYNTCEKMAYKRALVSATLTVTAASDIFTQDIEEMVENGAIQPKPTTSKPPVQQPQEKQGGDLSVVTGIEQVTQKSGEKNGKPWTLYTIHAGEKYTTFDKKHAEAAKAASESGLIMVLTYTQTDKGRNLLSITEQIDRQPGEEG